MPRAARASLRPISSVTIDLTLTTSRAPAAQDEVSHDAIGGRGVRGPVHDAAGAGDRCLELLQVMSRWRIARALMRRPASRSCSQSSSSATTAARLSRIVWVATRRLWRNWESRRATRAASGKPPLHQLDALGGGEDLGQVHGAHAGALAREPAADVQQARAVKRRAHLGAGIEDRAHLVGQHRRRGVGVLDREGAPEAAAALGLGQLDEVDPAHVAQQGQRRVADREHPQRVAAGVVGHAVGEVGARRRSTPSSSTRNSESSNTRGASASAACASCGRSDSRARRA